MTLLNILITAGPTQESLDPVRFITNHSTGHMGYSIAKKARRRKHHVTLISGPVPIKAVPKVHTINVRTAQEMFTQVKKHIRGKDCLIMAAAVSDFRPKAYSKTKIKKTNAIKSIRLIRNPDIVSWAGAHKRDCIIVGFCLETQALLSRAKEKLHAKNADIIIANKVNKLKSPFGKAPTDVIIMDKEKSLSIRQASKEKIAGIILEKIEDLWYKKHSVHDV
jgi:phosphopantothenoylcysteine decarboxylase / phosphopantothenate---cysteine ligase